MSVVLNCSLCTNATSNPVITVGICHICFVEYFKLQTNTINLSFHYNTNDPYEKSSQTVQGLF